MVEEWKSGLHRVRHRVTIAVHQHRGNIGVSGLAVQEPVDARRIMSAVLGGSADPLRVACVTLTIVQPFVAWKAAGFLDMAPERADQVLADDGGIGASVAFRDAAQFPRHIPKLQLGKSLDYHLGFIRRKAGLHLIRPAAVEYHNRTVFVRESIRMVLSDQLLP